jgi:hypothetical protein
MATTRDEIEPDDPDLVERAPRERARDIPTVSRLQLGDDWRDSRSVRRVMQGEPATVEQIDGTRFSVQLGDGGTHCVTAYIYGADAPAWHSHCTCEARCPDCAHVMLLLLRRNELPITVLYVESD